jgi:Rrf2 family protein
MAMADLALKGVEGSVRLNEIADRQQISPAYLEQIFLRLRRAGLIESERGRTGGYRLARPASAITIADVMAAADEPIEMTRCISEGLPGCVKHARCLTHDLWDALTDHIQEFLERVTLEDVVSGRLPISPLPRLERHSVRVLAK